MYDTKNATIAKRAVLSRLAGNKKTKEETAYRPVDIENEDKSCLTCISYLAVDPGAETAECEKVTGIVKANAICDLWIKEKGLGRLALDTTGPGIEITITAHQEQ